MDAYRIKDSIALASIELSRNKLVRVADGRGIEVSVVYGSVWITQHQDPNDICLGAGESFRIDRDGVTVVSALKASLVTLTLPATRDCALRVSMVAAGGEPVELFETRAPEIWAV